MKKNNSSVHIWRFDHLPLFYFGPKMLIIKKNILFGNQLKVANYSECQPNLLSNIQRIFGHFSRPPQKNWWHILKSVFKVGWIMWTQNYIHTFFLINAMVTWKSKFSDSMSSSLTLKKVDWLTTRAFETTLKVPKDPNWCNILKSGLKIGKTMWTLNYIFFFSK